VVTAPQQDTRFRSDMSVKLLDSMGDDTVVCDTARVAPYLGSRADRKGGGLTKSDRGLLNMLMRDRHGTPWESVVFRFFIDAPVFVAREAHRHRIASINETSARYRELEPVFYLPRGDRPMVQTGKPGAYVFGPGRDQQYHRARNLIMENSTESYQRYREMLDAGIAREVARMVLPVNIYTSWILTINLRSLMNFLSLRRVTGATTVPTFPLKEIEMVAELMEQQARRIVPVALELFDDYGRTAP
jgi:thymidylate synthase (FAD)